MFSGGLNTRLAPQLIKQDQGVKYQNIDLSLGTLTSVKDKLATAIETEKYATYYNAGEEWVSSSVKTEYLEFQGVLYSTDGIQSRCYTSWAEFHQ